MRTTSTYRTRCPALPSASGKRLAGIVGVVVMVAALMAWPTGINSRAAAAVATPVTLSSEDSWDIDAESQSWADAVKADTGGAVTLSPLLATDQQARRSLAGAQPQDYVISGRPFQPGDAPAGDNPISVPIMPTGVEFLFNPPAGGFQLASGQPWGPQGQNPVPWVPGQSNLGHPCVVSTATSNGCSPINVPANNLAAMYASGGNGPDGFPYQYWGSSAIMSVQPDPQADGTPINFVPGTAAHPSDPFPALNGGAEGLPTFWLVESPNDDNYYLQDWLTTLNTDADLVAAGKGLPAGEQFSPEEDIEDPQWLGRVGNPFTPQESLPAAQGLVAQSEPDLDTLLAIQPKANGGQTWSHVLSPGSDLHAGAIAVTPPSGQVLVDREEATTKTQDAAAGIGDPKWAIPEELSIPNANGDFVAPTPGAVEAGVNAGTSAGEAACSNTDTNADYAATHAVPGAYPITWVDCMYVPTKGLSVAKTDAVAGVIRYLVTDGQNVLNSSGDGRLNPTYVAQAVQAADAVVADNCPSAGGRVVVTASPTPYTPISPGVQALGAQAECEAVVAPVAPKPSTAPTATPPGHVVQPSSQTSNPSRTTTPSSPASSPSSPTTPGPGLPGTSGPGLGSGFGSGFGFGSGSNLAGGSGFGNGSDFANGSGTSSGGFSTGGTSGSGQGLGVSSGSSSGNGSTSRTGPASASRPGPVTAQAPRSEGDGQSSSGRHGPVALVASIASNLPIPLVAQGQSIDKLTALLLGGVLFLGVRGGVRRILRAKRG